MTPFLRIDLVSVFGKMRSLSEYEFASYAATALESDKDFEKCFLCLLLKIINFNKLNQVSSN